MTRARDVADTQDNTGGAVAPFVAGKNKIINGDFGVWQRGTTFTVTGTESVVYKADRWEVQADGTTTTRTISRQTFTPGTAPVAGYEGQYFFRYAQTTAGNNTYNYISTRLEDCRLFAGQTVTLSFWAKADSARTINTFINQVFGSGGSGVVTSAIQGHSLTTSWQRFTHVINLASITGKTIGPDSFLNVVFQFPAGNITPTIDVWGVQLEAGNVATPFTTATGTIQGELAACQRYCVVLGGVSVYTAFGLGQVISTTQAGIVIPLPVRMRSNPVGTYSTTLSNYAVWNNNGALTNLTSLVDNQMNRDSVQLIATVASGLTAGSATTLWSNNTTNATIIFSAEL